MTPHKHAEIIKAWADGAEIEWLNYGQWLMCSNNKPVWCENDEYRVKPTPKPDVWQWTCAYLDINNDLCIGDKSCYANLKLTFDGETRKLKAAEVIE
jgi:hypothetical protein